ncbi:MAG: hypothetical protein GC146_06505 [Limimaricola sp.]|uniref:hypothetical protein n=1 Tax=Limimaricola sp. TaxID=2211665 RepID=UPI001DE71C6E|nr:hypothetical protein [Limimaricola sp.]MBI1416859.1 hypothetical protein [Limimaricola sp.]
MSQPVDIGFEIVGLELERDALKRDMRINQWAGLAALLVVIGLGPNWLALISNDNVLTLFVGLAVFIGIAEKLNRHRLRHVHDRIIDLRLREKDGGGRIA